MAVNMGGNGTLSLLIGNQSTESGWFPLPRFFLDKQAKSKDRTWSCRVLFKYCEITWKVKSWVVIFLQLPVPSLCFQGVPWRVNQKPTVCFQSSTDLLLWGPRSSCATSMNLPSKETQLSPLPRKAWLSPLIVVLLLRAWSTWLWLWVTLS